MSAAEAVAPEPEVVRRAEYEQTPYELTHTKLVWEIQSATNVQVHSTMDFKLRTQSPGDLKTSGDQPALELDKHPGLSITSVQIDGQGTEYEETDTKLIIRPTSESFQVSVTTDLNPTANKDGMGLYAINYDKDENPETIGTLFESIGHRRVTPTYDRPDVMPTWETTIRAPRDLFPEMLATGNKTHYEADIGDGRHEISYDHPYQLPSYLYAMIAGALVYNEKEITQANGTTVNIRVYSKPENLKNCEVIMQALTDAIHWDEEEFGLPYDLAEYKVVVADRFNAGAMENKGLLVFSTKHASSSPELSHDRNIVQVYTTTPHEHIHNFAGNRVTLRSWHEIALKEGLTSFKDKMFREQMIGPVSRIRDVRVLKSRQFGEDAGAEPHAIIPDEYSGDPMNSMYDATTYHKGAEVNGMMRALVGADRFKKGLATYFKKRDGQAVTMEDLITDMEEGAEVDLTLFRNWLKQVGTPVCKVTSEYDETTKRYTLKVTQECTREPHLPLMIPMNMGLIGPNGEEVPLKLMGETNGHDLDRGMLVLSEPEHTFVFEEVPPGTIPSLFRNFSAPVKVEYEYSTADLIHIMKNDSDHFNRYEAAERIATSCLTELVRRIQGGEEVKTGAVDAQVIQAFGTVLDYAELEPAVAAEILKLPTLLALVQNPSFDHYDFDAASSAIKILKKAIAEAHEEKLLEAYSSNTDIANEDVITDGNVNIKSIHVRSFRNECLKLLMSLGDNHISLAQDQFESPVNMTNERESLEALLMNPTTREEALATFTARWGEEKIPMTALLQIQGEIDDENLVERIKEITERDSFNPDDTEQAYPLLVHGLLQNFKNFHHISGKGYKFIADTIISFKNGQLAVRMAKDAFQDYPNMDQGRQALMKIQMQRILNSDAHKAVKAKIIQLLPELAE